MISRIRRLPTETREALLAAACASHPTVDLVSSARRDDDGIARALARAERAGVITVAGADIEFAHPLLAAATQANAASDARRRAHRLLAAAVGDPEERARHLALATTRRDERVARAFCEAAARLEARGGALVVRCVPAADGTCAVEARVGGRTVGRGTARTVYGRPANVRVRLTAAAAGSIRPGATLQIVAAVPGEGTRVLRVRLR